MLSDQNCEKTGIFEHIEIGTFY